MELILLNTAIYALAGLGCLITGALVLNKLPFHQPPGLSVRLYTYLTSNIAETKRGHRFPELELPVYPVSAWILLARVEHSMLLLGWHIANIDREKYRIQAVVETVLLKFKDDVEVRLVPAANGTELHVRSMSRLGRADFGTNARHVLNLIKTIARLA